MPNNTGTATTRHSDDATAAEFMAVVFALDMIPLNARLDPFDLKLIVRTKGGK